MRLSINLLLEGTLPFERTAQRAANLGFKGVGFEYDPSWTDADCRSIREAFDDKGVAIVQVACHETNLIHPNDDVRKRSVSKIRSAMRAARVLGSDVVVAMAGTRHPEALGGKWPRAWLAHAENFSVQTWELLVRVLKKTLQDIEGDGVKFCLEPVSLTPVNSVERLSRLLRDVNSSLQKVLLDPVNLVTSVEDYFRTTDLTNTMFDVLGSDIAAVHAKDTSIRQELTLHLDEVPPGKGNLDYSTLLRRLNELPSRIPLIVEHVSTDEEITFAKKYIESIAGQIGARFV